MEAPDWMESMAAAMTVVVAVVEGKQVTAVVTEVLVVGCAQGSQWSGRRQWAGVVRKTTVLARNGVHHLSDRLQERGPPSHHREGFAYNVKQCPCFFVVVFFYYFFLNKLIGCI